MDLPWLARARRSHFATPPPSWTRPAAAVLLATAVAISTLSVTRGPGGLLWCIVGSLALGFPIFFVELGWRTHLVNAAYVSTLALVAMLALPVLSGRAHWSWTYLPPGFGVIALWVFGGAWRLIVEGTLHVPPEWERAASALARSGPDRVVRVLEVRDDALVVEVLGGEGRGDEARGGERAPRRLPRERAPDAQVGEHLLLAKAREVRPEGGYRDDAAVSLDAGEAIALGPRLEPPRRTLHAGIALLAACTVGYFAGIVLFATTTTDLTGPR